MDELRPIRIELTLTPEAAQEIKRLADTYGATVSQIVQGGSRMLDNRAVVSQIDDDFLRRLVDAIEDACGVHDDERPRETVVQECIDGDLFLAYQEVHGLFVAAYPGWGWDE